MQENVREFFAVTKQSLAKFGDNKVETEQYMSHQKQSEETDQHTEIGSTIKNFFDKSIFHSLCIGKPNDLVQYLAFD